MESGLEARKSDEATKDERNIAALTHVSGIFFSALVPFVVWLVKKEESPYLGAQSAEALNFQITMLIAHMAAGVSVMFLVGFLLLPLVVVANVVLSLIAAVKASNGETYKYPFSIRLIQ